MATSTELNQIKSEVYTLLNTTSNKVIKKFAKKHKISSDLRKFTSWKDIRNHAKAESLANEIKSLDYEVAYLVMDDGRAKQFTNYCVDSVAIQPMYFDMLKPVIFVHNHPFNVSLSIDDLKLHLKHQSLAKSWAVTQDNVLYEFSGNNMNTETYTLDEQIELIQDQIDYLEETEVFAGLNMTMYSHMLMNDLFNNSFDVVEYSKFNLN